MIQREWPAAVAPPALASMPIDPYGR